MLSFINGASVLAAPAVIGQCVDSVANLEALRPKLYLLFFLFAAGFVSHFALGALTCRAANIYIRELRNKAFAKISNMPVSFFDNSRIGDLLSRFSNDTEAVVTGALQLSPVFISILTVVGSAGLMIRTDYKTGIVVIVIAPLTAAFLTFLTKKLARAFDETQRLMGEYGDNIEESFRNIETVKAFSLENEMNDSAAEINGRLYTAGQKSQFYSSLANPTSRLINHFTYCAVGLSGAVSALSGRLSIGAVSALLAYAVQITKPLNEVSSVWTQLMQASAALKRVNELIGLAEEPPEDDKPDLEFKNGEVEFKNVSFSYDKNSDKNFDKISDKNQKSNKNILENFSVKIPPKSVTAIVGKTGAGKTTLVNLLMRFYEIDSGEILIDGQNAFEKNRESVRAAFGMILQDTRLFSGTVAENISYGKKDATLGEIKDAAKRARADSFISRLPNGYETIIDDEASGLSAGERQLLTIARAVLADSPALILDEATSAVDPLTEKQIQKTFLELRRNKTCFIIAHRLSTIVDADLILEMDGGKVSEIKLSEI